MSDIIVIGGGPAGLAAAITAGKAGRSVTLLEGNEKPGRKLKSTGNGKCNLGNAGPTDGSYMGSDPGFANRLFSRVTPEDVRMFFDECGIILRCEEGLYYPYNEEAESVLSALLNKAEKCSVKIKNNAKVTGVLKEDGVFKVRTKDRDYEGDRLIIASGSCASDIKGSDGSGYELARSLLHGIVEPLPALVPLICRGCRFGKWAGTRVKGSAALVIDGSEAGYEKGIIQLTNYGVSGICIFNLSALCTRALREGRKVELYLDFAPDMDREILINEIALKGTGTILPQKLGKIIEDMSGNVSETADNIKFFRLEVESTASFAHAQCAAGGIDTGQVKDNMESAIVDGLYFAGEILDIHGKCGGFNLQFAFASGIEAGRSAAYASD